MPTTSAQGCAAGHSMRGELADLVNAEVSLEGLQASSQVGVIDGQGDAVVNPLGLVS